MTNLTSIDNTDSKDENLPSNVDSKEQLACLPERYLSDDPKRPLLLTTCDESLYGDGKHSYFKYALRPLWYSAFLILVVELMERFTYYGIGSIQTAFLTGAYQPNWNPEMSAVQASMYTSTSIGIAYTVPFVGGIIADGFLGDYWSIVFGLAALYIPGVLLIALSTIPGLLGPTFNMSVLTAGLLVLMPLGTGFIKSIVNIFGAKQFHPLLQSDQIEVYYVNFYMIINIGALVGGIAIPIIAQYDLEVALLIPVGSLILGFLLFLSGSRRYVRRPASKAALFDTLRLIGKQMICKPFEASKKSNGGAFKDDDVDGVKRLLQVVPLSMLILPFTIAYSQMSTVFIVQGEAMKSLGVLDASLIGNFDPISVLISSFLVSSVLLPYLSKRDLRIPATYKYAIGTFLSALAILSAIIVDGSIKKAYHANSGAQVPVIWQIFNYALVGIGEVFTMAPSYELVYTVAPKSQKALASAVAMFLSVGLANFISTGLYGACSAWFPQNTVGSSKTEQYVEADLQKYMWLLFGIGVGGTILNLLPPVRNWVERLRRDAMRATASMESSSSHPSDETVAQILDVEDNNCVELASSDCDGDDDDEVFVSIIL
jgi:dipeptide/tripeptide permease